MIETIKRLLKPPTFADAIQNRTAQTLNAILWLVLLGSILLTASGLYFNDVNTIAAFTLLGMVSIISLFVMRQGNLTVPALLLPTLMLGLISYLVAISSATLRDVAMYGFSLIIVLGGLLLGRRGVIIFTTLTVLSITLIGYLELNGTLVSRFGEDAIMAYDVFLINFIMVFIGFFLYLLLNNLNQIVAREQQREQELEKSNNELEALSASLEARVQARTNDLALAAEIGQNVLQLQDSNSLLVTAVNLIQAHFNLYYTQIYTLNNAGDQLVLQAGTGQAGKELRARNHHLSLNDTSINGKAARTKQAQLVPDTVTSPDFQPNDLLPQTRSEMAVPLLIGTEVLGVLNLQSEQPNALTEEILPAFEIVAGQLAVAINNANLFAEREEITTTLAEEQTRIQAILDAITLPMVISRMADGLVLYVNDPLSQAIELPAAELIGQQTPDFYYDPTDRQHLLDTLREKGSLSNYELQLKRADGTPFWALLTGRIINYQGDSALLITLLDVTEQHQTQTIIVKRAKELASVAEIGTAAATILDADILLQKVVTLTKESFDLYHAHIYLLDDHGENLVLTTGAGDVGEKMVAEGRIIPVAKTQSLVARAARTRQGVISNDVRTEPDFLPNPLLPDTRSEMAIPLIAGNKLLGVLDVQSDEVGHFNEEDINIQTTLAAQIASALQNVQQYVATQKSLVETEQLYGISSRLNTTQTTAEILQAVILPSINQGASSATLFAIETDETGQPEWLAVLAEWQLEGRPVFSVGTRFYVPDYPGTTDWMNNPVAQLIGDIPNDPQLDSATKAVYEQAQAKATVTLPLRVRQQWVGTVSIIWTEVQTFTEEDQRFYQTLADQTAVMLNTQLLVERTQRRAHDLSTVAKVGSAVIQELDVDQLLQTVVDLTKEEFDLYHAHIYLYDDAHQTLSLSAGAGDIGQQLVDQGHNIPLEREKSLVARAARSHEAIIVNDVQSDPGFMANALLPDTRSEMAVPLIAGEELIGVLDVQSVLVGRFSEDEANIYTTLASQVAIAVQNDRQYEQTRLALEDANLFRQFIEESGQGIGWADMNGRILYMNHSLMDMLEIDSIEDALEHNSFEFYPPDTEKFLLETVVPIVLEKGSWIGEIVAKGKRGRLLPTLHNLFLVRDAEGVSRYLGNVVTDITERKKAEEGQQKLTREMEEQITQINALQRAMTHEGWEAFFTSKDRPIQGYMFDSKNLRPMKTGELMQHGGEHIQVDLSAVTQPVYDDTATAVATPMRVRGEVIGVIGARHPDGHPLTEDQQAILSALSGQVGEALERTRLFEETELGRQQLNQRANELQAVAEITTAISSLLDEQQLLETVTYMTQRRFNLYHCHIFLVNEKEQKLQIKACGWQEGDPHEGTHGDSAIALDQATSLVAQSAREQQPIIVNDVHNDPHWLPNELLPDTQSEMAVPLIAGGQVIGVLDVQSEQLNRFSEEDVRIQVTLAAQIGVALQNVRQYSMTQRRANRERLINEISQKIQSAQTVQTALQTAVAELGQAFNAKQVIVSLAANEETADANGS